MVPISTIVMMPLLRDVVNVLLILLRTHHQEVYYHLAYRFVEHVVLRSFTVIAQPTTNLQTKLDRTVAYTLTQMVIGAFKRCFAITHQTVIKLLQIIQMSNSKNLYPDLTWQDRPIMHSKYQMK